MLEFYRHHRRGVFLKSELPVRNNNEPLQFCFVFLGRQYKSMREPNNYNELLQAAKALILHQVGSRFEEQTTLNLQCGLTEIIIDSEPSFNLLKQRVWRMTGVDILILISHQPILDNQENRDGQGALSVVRPRGF